MIAEGLGDPGFQRWLVVFDDEQIMAMAVADMLADLSLGEDRITGDDCAVKRQSLQQHQGGTDFVLIGRDDEVTDDST